MQASLEMEAHEDDIESSNESHQNLPNLSVKEDSGKVIVFLVLSTEKLPKTEN